MSGIVIVIAVGIFVASLVAFAVNVMVPGSDSNSTEDRLAAMASRRRGGAGADESDKGSLLLAGGLDDKTTVFSKVLENLPALADYLDQADVQMQPSKFAFICLACFASGIGICSMTPVPILLGPILGVMLVGLPIGWVMMKRKKTACQVRQTNAGGIGIARPIASCRTLVERRFWSGSFRDGSTSGDRIRSSF